MNTDTTAEPIRNYRQVAEIMRQRGDATMTAGTAWAVEKRALEKLRVLLKEYKEEATNG